jgi:DNA-binding response OmpR family regulator
MCAVEGQVETILGRVLFVTDDAGEGRFWVEALRRRGIDVAVAGPAGEALGEGEQDPFDVVVLDIQARPEAMALLRTFRTQLVNPILLLAPESDEDYCLEAYRAGADECIRKPSGAAIFAAKVTAWLRHRWTVRIEALEPVEGGGLRLEPECHQVVTASGATVGLTNLELRLLYLLMRNPGQVLPPETILPAVWGGDGGGDARALRSVVRRLRLKIEPDPRHPRTLLTAGGRGYTFCG